MRPGSVYSARPLDGWEGQSDDWTIDRAWWTTTERRIYPKHSAFVGPEYDSRALSHFTRRIGFGDGGRGLLDRRNAGRFRHHRHERFAHADARGDLRIWTWSDCRAGESDQLLCLVSNEHGYESGRIRLIQPRWHVDRASCSRRDRRHCESDQHCISPPPAAGGGWRLFTNPLVVFHRWTPR